MLVERRDFPTYHPDVRAYFELQLKHRKLQNFFRRFPAFTRLPASAVTDILLTELRPVAALQLHFTEGPLEGLKLIGFSIWESRRGGSAGRNVTFPARQYSVNGERRSFALLRPVADATAQARIRELILDAYAEFEEQAGRS
jgi:hypothetical protein